MLRDVYTIEINDGFFFFKCDQNGLSLTTFKIIAVNGVKVHGISGMLNGDTWNPNNGHCIKCAPPPHKKIQWNASTEANGWAFSFSLSKCFRMFLWHSNFHSFHLLGSSLPSERAYREPEVNGKTLNKHLHVRNCITMFENWTNCECMFCFGYCSVEIKENGCLNRFACNQTIFFRSTRKSAVTLSIFPRFFLRIQNHRFGSMNRILWQKSILRNFPHIWLGVTAARWLNLAFAGNHLQRWILHSNAIY